MLVSKLNHVSKRGPMRQQNVRMNEWLNFILFMRWVYAQQLIQVMCHFVAPTLAGSMHCTCPWLGRYFIIIAVMGGGVKGGVEFSLRSNVMASVVHINGFFICHTVILYLSLTSPWTKAVEAYSRWHNGTQTAWLRFSRSHFQLNSL